MLGVALAGNPAAETAGAAAVWTVDRTSPEAALILSRLGVVGSERTVEIVIGFFGERLIDATHRTVVFPVLGNYRPVLDILELRNTRLLGQEDGTQTAVTCEWFFNENLQPPWFTGCGPQFVLADNSEPASLRVPAGVVQDLAGNRNLASRELWWQRPSVVIGDPGRGPVNGPFPVTFTFSEPVTGFGLGDLRVQGGCTTALAADETGTVWTATITPSAGRAEEFAVTVGLSADAVVNEPDPARPDRVSGIGNAAGAPYTRALDQMPPTVVIDSPTGGPAGGAFAVSPAFSEEVSGLTAADLVVSGGLATGVAGAGARYEATIEPAAGVAGEVTVALPAGAVSDAAGNANAASATYRREADLEAPAVSLPERRDVHPRGGPDRSLGELHGAHVAEGGRGHRRHDAEHQRYRHRLLQRHGSAVGAEHPQHDGRDQRLAGHGRHEHRERHGDGDRHGRQPRRGADRLPGGGHGGPDPCGVRLQPRHRDLRRHRPDGDRAERGADHLALLGDARGGVHGRLVHRRVGDRGPGRVRDYRHGGVERRLQRGHRHVHGHGGDGRDPGAEPRRHHRGRHGQHRREGGGVHDLGRHRLGGGRVGQRHP